MPIVVYSGDPTLGEGDPNVSMPGTGTSVPGGKESILKYNGLRLNDRSTIDKYRILTMDGLDDPDVRDTRELNPATHGETAYDAFYGGRTIALNGRIEAYTLNKLRDMQQALKSAFADLEEKQLIFLTPSGNNHYINCRKFSKIQWTEEQTRLNHYFRDFLITLRASNPRFFGFNKKSYTLYPNFIIEPTFEDHDNGDAPDDWNGYFEGGTWTSYSFDVADNWGWGDYEKSIRLVGTKANDATEDILGLQCAKFSVEPDTEYTVQIRVKAQNQASTGVKIVAREFISEAVFNRETVSPYNNTFGEFTLTHTFTTESDTTLVDLQVEAVSSVALDIVNYRFGDFWFTNAANETPGFVSINNEGNFKTQPKITFNGGMSKMGIRNDTNDSSFLFKSTASIDSGESRIVNSKNNTVTDGFSQNKFGEVDFSGSSWLDVEPGNNSIFIKSDDAIATSSDAFIKIEVEDAWI